MESPRRPDDSIEAANLPRGRGEWAWSAEVHASELSVPPLPAGLEHRDQLDARNGGDGGSACASGGCQWQFRPWRNGQRLGSTSTVGSGRLAPRGAYDEVPAYWHEAAQWLEDNAAGSGSGADAERALVVPGAPFGAQVWGLTRDEPLQALASTPWAVRDAVPLVPPGAIRALDSVQRIISDGRPSAGLADTLLGQGIRYVVVRNDLDPDTSRSTRPLLVHQTVDGSPGLEKVAEFGEEIVPDTVDDVVIDSDLRPGYPAVEIYRVTSPDGATPAAGPYAVDLDRVPVVQGGSESLLRLAEKRHRDRARTARVGCGPCRHRGHIGDGHRHPTNRETDFGQVDNHSSALRGPDDERRTYNAVPDYPVPGAALVEGEWSGATLSVSSAASDATQLGGTAPGSGPAATVDGDPATAWLSNGLETARGQWLRLDFDTPITRGMLHLTTSPAAFGPPVKWIRVETRTARRRSASTNPENPSTCRCRRARRRGCGSSPPTPRTAPPATSSASARSPSTTTPPAPRCPCRSSTAPCCRRRPPVRRSAAGTWGRNCRDVRVAPTVRTACTAAARWCCPEEPGTFTRTLSVPESTSVTPQLTLRPRPGAALEASSPTR
ncbi:DUF3367 domain-containing protein, partial [Rhodococcus hoagii]|nr:DUF3367 domain-containing protein [Prescottella equi]